MTTWTQLSARCRRMLKDDKVLADPGAKVKWTDTELLEYANDGIRDLSRVTPKTASTSLTGNGAVYTMSMPADFLHLYWVQWHDGTIISQLNIEVGTALPTETTLRTELLGYLLDYPTEGTLTFTRVVDTGKIVTLHYAAYRALLTGGADTLPFTRFLWMEDALAYYVAAVAHMREGVSRASLEQWSQRPDNAVGNPLNAEAREWLNQYRRKVQDNR